MKIRVTLLFLMFVSLVSACRSTQVPAPAMQNEPKQALVQKKETLQAKKKAASQLPEVLGGIVQSDEWIIYKEKEQEEFKGHVFYDNDIYVFKADYALSDRKQNTATARGHVYLKQQEKQSPTYEAWGDYGRYNYKTGKGILKSTSKTPARLQITDTTQTLTARAEQISFNTVTQVFVLTGNVDVQRTTQGNTQTLQADTVIYDKEHNTSTAIGKRPLATGSTEEGTFAIIADKVNSDAQATVVTLDGHVQGWVVSPELNNHKINRQF